MALLPLKFGFLQISEFHLLLLHGDPGKLLLLPYDVSLPHLVSFPPQIEGNRRGCPILSFIKILNFCAEFDRYKSRNKECDKKINKITQSCLDIIVTEDLNPS